MGVYSIVLIIICPILKLAFVGFIFGFLFLDICFNLTYAITNHLRNLRSWPEVKPWAFGVGVLTPRQRTNPREHQIVRTHTKETTVIQDLGSSNHQQHSVQDASSKQQTNKNTNTIISRQDYNLIQPYSSEEKETNKKLSTNLTLHKEVYTNQWTKLRMEETKRKKRFQPWSPGKGDIKHNKLKKKK